MTHEQSYPRDIRRRIWGDEQTEHLALRAAELGDHDTEALCDEVMAGMTESEVLIGLVNSDSAYTEWMERGINLGWKSRAT